MGICAKFDLFPHRFNWRDGRGCFWLMGQNLFDTETKSAQKKYIQIKENVRFLLLIADQKELLPTCPFGSSGSSQRTITVFCEIM